MSRSARWLVTGAEGMLAKDVLRALAERQPHVSVTAAGRARLDITDAGAVREAVAGHDLVVNCAAFTRVEVAEAAEDTARAVNGTAVGHLARACAAGGTRLVHVSTDYVFPGTSQAPCAEDAPTGPVNAYGRSKLLGEKAVAEILPEHGYTVRTAWLYGRHGPNFVTTMLRRAASQEVLEVVDDQYGQPTWTLPLARRLVDLGSAALRGEAPPGVYHGTSAGLTSWHGLARATFRLAGLDPRRVRPVDSASYPTVARRPPFSVLSHERWRLAGMPPLPPWEACLAAALEDGLV